MREIKFRAKRVDNGEWVYGDFKQYVNNSICPDFYTIDTKSANHTVLEETLGQFTGLCDKNSKEIYEGDIVKTKYIEKREFQTIKYDSEMEFIELVVFKDQAFQLEIDIEGIKLYRYLSFGKDARVYGDIKLREIEVIGNIHNNPELLKGE